MLWTGVLTTGEKVWRAGERREEAELVSIRFSFSLSPEEEELPMLARETRPFLLLEGVPGVAGVRPPLEGVLLVGPGVPGVADRPCALPARDRPGVPVPPPGVRGVPAVRLGVPAAEWDTRGPEDRRLPRPFGSMFWMEELAAVVPVAGAIG